MGHWQQTKLWQRLNKIEQPNSYSEKINNELKRWLPRIESVLKSGGTSPTDFTLHEEQHAFRVAERMVAIVPASVFEQLSSYELALLLLSAYLHDIGMTPQQGRIIAHRDYLLTGDFQERQYFGASEKHELQKWLDDFWDGIEPPINEHLKSDERYRLIDLIVTHYSRHKHNSWSAEWIRENAPDVSLYPNWLGDLVELCKSHHYGKAELETPYFDGQVIDNAGNFVNLRYLAAVLRLADVMENDPERTPEVIFEHRDISDGSRIYWYKDHHFVLTTTHEDERITCTAVARLPNAQLHKAVEQTLDMIDQELSLASALSEQGLYARAKAMDKPPFEYKWSLVPQLTRSIEPLNGAYEYIDGAFRPDTAKLLELLSGIELYGDPLVAVRELLQNAFDAVKEMVAVKRLKLPNPLDEVEVERIRNQHNVRINLEKDGEAVWLTCTDDGVGMDMEIISRHLLMSGKAKRHSILDLERRCRAAGFSMERTGHFGIGVLSYFMLADCVQIRTRRSPQAGSSEGHGWFFETFGVGSFGELKRDAEWAEGTQIRLRLRSDVVGENLEEWFEKLIAQVKDVVIKSPSNLFVSSNVNVNESLKIVPGWTRIAAQCEQLIMRALDNELATRNRYMREGTEVLSSDIERKLVRDREDLETIKTDISRRLKWLEGKGLLPDKQGSYYFAIPFFDLPGGVCCAYLTTQPLQTDEEELLYVYFPTASYMPDVKPLSGWKGVQVENKCRSLGCFVSLDLTSNDKLLTVNRNKLTDEEFVDSCIDYVKQQVADVARSYIDENQNSIYYWLNCRIFGFQPRHDVLVWPKVQGEYCVWSEVTGPVFDQYRAEFLRRYFFGGREIPILPSIDIQRPSSSEFIGPLGILGVGWNSSNQLPERLVLVDNKSIGYMWTEVPGERKSGLAQTIKFSPAWNDIWVYNESHKGYEFGNYGGSLLFNREHPLTRFLDVESWEQLNSNESLTTNPLPFSEQLLQDKRLAVSWLLYCLVFKRDKLWNGLIDKESAFLKRIWHFLAIDAQEIKVLCRARDRYSAHVLISCTPETWSIVELEHGKYTEVLGDPGEKFTVMSDGDRGSDHPLSSLYVSIKELPL